MRSTYTGSRLFAAGVYIIGFWFLDFANNTVQVLDEILITECCCSTTLHAVY
jgi:hypothetical protein